MESENIAFTIRETSEDTQIGYVVFPCEMNNINISLSASIETNTVTFEADDENKEKMNISMS